MEQAEEEEVWVEEALDQLSREVVEAPEEEEVFGETMTKSWRGSCSLGALTQAQPSRRCWNMSRSGALRIFRLQQLDGVVRSKVPDHKS